MADSGKGLTTLMSELWDLVLAYVKQETIDPLKSLVRFLGWGVGGAVCLAMGLVLLSLGGLRAVQLELSPHLSGNWSWVPYLLVVVFAAAVMGILARAIGAEKRRVEAERAQLGVQKGSAR